MDAFSYRCPTRIIFGVGQIVALSIEVPAAARILMVHGGGSIMRNGVYDQVQSALSRHQVVEFDGIRPNPEYEDCREALEVLKESSCDFILAVGGGSVLDAAKFIAAAACYDGEEPWDLIEDRNLVTEALPVGAVLTLPATGSEMNGNTVISRAAITQKRALCHPALYPVFSILDPATTTTLSPRQSANGIIDAFVHVCEQYVTYPAEAPLQDRQAEAILLTLIEEGPKVMADPENLTARANVMWAATNALNGLIGVGVPGDWASHQIGHELTALYGIDHAQSLAVAMPGVWEVCREAKQAKLAQYAWRVWGLHGLGSEVAARQAVARTEDFFRSLGVGTTLAEYDIPVEAADLVAQHLSQRGVVLGEHQSITPEVVAEILRLRA